MPTDRQLDRTISSWLEADAPGQLPDRVLHSTFERTRRSRQERGWRAVPGRLQMMHRPILAFGAVAAVAVVAVGGLGLMNQSGSAGGVATPPAIVAPTATPTAAPSATPTAAPTATPVQSPTPAEGALKPGVTYVAHPLPSPDAALAVTFTAPGGWETFGGPAVLVPSGAPGTGGPGGMAIQLVAVTSVNSDACHWKGQKDDIDGGSTVDDLVRALRQQTTLQASKPVDVTLGGYSGKRVDVVAPTEPFANSTDNAAPSCDDGVMELWSTTAFLEAGISLQGPENRWQVNILDVAGTRFVVVAQDYPGTSTADRAALDAILSSMVITP